MTRLQLSSKTREDFRKSQTKKLRREGQIPATVYGRGDESKAIAIEFDDFVRILKTPGGRLSLIDLKVDGRGEKSHPVMIQEIQRHPITKKVLHVDFHRVSLDEPVNATIPITLVGDAPGTKQGGILEQFTHELEVRALPERIPTHVDVDISHLELGQSIHVSEVQLPDDVDLLGPVPENVVAVCRLPIVHIEEVEEVEEIEGVEEGAEAAEAPAEEEAGEES